MKVVGVISFDYDHLGRWLRLGAIKCIRFHQRWINFSGKEEIWGEEEVLRIRKNGNEEEGWRGRGSGLSRFIKDIDYNGVFKWKGKWKRKKKKRKIFRNMLVLSKKNVFVLAKIFAKKILSILYLNIVFMWNITQSKEKKKLLICSVLFNHLHLFQLHIHACTHTYTHTHTYIHTHTHTYIYIYIYNKGKKAWKIILICSTIYIYIYIYLSQKSSQCPRTVDVDYSLHRIYESNHIKLWECSMHGYC